jgi:hypothetical protein
VAHPIPPQPIAAGRSLSAQRHGKAHLHITQSPDVSEEESDDGTDVNAYLNTTIVTPSF